LHSALFIVPVFGVLLGLVLFVASRTVAKDMEKLQHWMRESVNSEAKPYADAAD
jgi:fructose-specific phosphotransferase system IIC component